MFEMLLIPQRVKVYYEPGMFNLAVLRQQLAVSSDQSVNFANYGQRIAHLTDVSVNFANYGQRVAYATDVSVNFANYGMRLAIGVTANSINIIRPSVYLATQIELDDPYMQQKVVS